MKFTCLEFTSLFNINSDMLKQLMPKLVGNAIKHLQDEICKYPLSTNVSLSITYTSYQNELSKCNLVCASASESE